MYQFFVEPHQISDKTVRIEGQDVNHIKNVLRMKIGEELSVSNGVDGKEYRCGIVAMDEECITCELRFVKEDGMELPSQVYLFQGLPKADKMELIIQKAVELGVYAVVPVATKRCVVKLDDKKAKSKIARWQGISEAAAKLIPYELAEDMSKTKEIIGALQPGQRIAIFIGPEGGFEEAEVEAAMNVGVQPITLGKRILRTETAGFTVLSWIMYELEE